ncbi:MAG: SCP2 sterol-binding domain-containing protein [Acidimicrobiales bacterium]
MTAPEPVPPYLSDAWLTAATNAVAGLTGPAQDEPAVAGLTGPAQDEPAVAGLTGPEGGSREATVIGYDLVDPATGEPGGLSYRLVIARDGIRFVRRHPDEPDVRFRLDVATATAVAAGRINAQRAVLDGRIMVTGDPRILLDVADTMTAIEAGLRPLLEPDRGG